MQEIFRDEMVTIISRLLNLHMLDRTKSQQDGSRERSPLILSLVRDLGRVGEGVRGHLSDVCLPSVFSLLENDPDVVRRGKLTVTQSAPTGKDPRPQSVSHSPRSATDPY